MGISAVNKYKSKNKWQWAGRGTPLGNPFYMANPSMRESVCDQYEDHFFKKVVLDKDPKMLSMLTDLTEQSEKGDVEVACVCHPQRCHVHTVVNYIKEGISGLHPVDPKLILLKEVMLAELDKGPINRFIDEYRWLSNFKYLRTPIVEDGISYPTVEHYFQANKTLDRVERELVAEQPSATAAKRRGRNVKMRNDWDEVKESVMYKGLQYKFRDSELIRKLLDTDDRELIEGNWHHDKYWGYCLHNNTGDNRLGKLLMKLRNELAL